MSAARGRVARTAIERLTSRRSRLWAAALGLLALALCRLPLFNVLGFEFAFAMAIAGSVAGADLGATLVRRVRAAGPAQDRDVAPGGLVAQLLGWATLWVAAVLFLPLVIVCLNGIWVRNCDWLFGFECFFLMSVMSSALAAGMGVVVTLWLGARWWIGLLAPFAVLLGYVVASFLHFYRSPAVFSYNPFAGYFPGNLYDESIDLRAPFYWARAYYVCLLAFLAAATAICLDVDRLRLRWPLQPREVRASAAPGVRRWRPLIVAVFFLGVFLTLHARRGSLEFVVDADDIEQALTRRFETEHFVIYFAGGGDIEKDIELIAEDHEFRRAQLVRDLGVDPAGKIKSMYFESADQKFRLMGARNVYMAKPWRREIYVNHDDFPHRVLRHEIAHVVAGEFGDPIFGVSVREVLGLPLIFNVGMIEGTAVASDWPDHFDKALTPHQSARALQELGMAPPVNNLFSTGFLAFSSARSYTTAGSYLRYVIDEFGVEALRDLYRTGGDFEGALGVPQSQVTAGWQETIANTELEPGAAEVVRERFRRPAIFERPCPHAIARLQTKIARARSRGHVSEAVELARQICADLPGEPSAVLALAGLLVQAKHLDEADALYRQIHDDQQNVSSTLRAQAFLQRASLAMAENRSQVALALLEQASTLPLDDDLARQVEVELSILRHEGPAARPLRRIFWSSDPAAILDRVVLVALAAEALRLEPDHALAQYLLARQIVGRDAPDEATSALSRALQRKQSKLVEREAARMLAMSAFRAGDLDKVVAAADILVREDQPQVTRLLGYDWLERVVYRRTGAVPAKPLGWHAGRAQMGLPSSFASTKPLFGPPHIPDKNIQFSPSHSSTN